MTWQTTKTVSEILKDENWIYKNNGYWLDPITGNKYMTNVALQIVKEREAVQPVKITSPSV